MILPPDIESKLQTYLKLLQKWQSKINLVSSNTIDNAWERHFIDSLQILDILPEGKKTLFDLGCGAGFPGLVLAIARRDLKVHLIESDQKKCSFLKTVSRETQTRVTIQNCRIESVSRETMPDIITARALASLEVLFEYCAKWIEENSNLILIFPKGEKADEEIAELSKKWKFNCRTYSSKTDDNAKILIFTEACRL